MKYSIFKKEYIKVKIRIQYSITGDIKLTSIAPLFTIKKSLSVLVCTMPEKSLMFKVLTAGDGGVGKTTLLYRYVKGEFLEDTRMTLGVGFFLKELVVNDLNVTLQLWDFGGQDRFQFLHQSYSEGAKGGILMYDLTRPSTLDRIDYWVDICRKNNPGIPLIFIGGKSDLKDQRNVSEELVNQIIEKYDFCEHLEVSSKSGEKVERVFETISEHILL